MVAQLWAVLMLLCSVGGQLVHLDLKSQNVLLHDKNFLVAKIADLGLSKYLSERSLLNLSNIPGAAHLSSIHSSVQQQKLSVTLNASARRLPLLGTPAGALVQGNSGTPTCQTSQYVMLGCCRGTCVQGLATLNSS